MKVGGEGGDGERWQGVKVATASDGERWQGVAQGETNIKNIYNIAENTKLCPIGVFCDKTTMFLGQKCRQKHHLVHDWCI